MVKFSSILYVVQNRGRLGAPMCRSDVIDVIDVIALAHGRVSTAPLLPTNLHARCYMLVTPPFKVGIRRPVFASPMAVNYLTTGRWSPTRPGVVFLGKVDGSMDVWDFTDSSYTPSVTLMSSPSRITRWGEDSVGGVTRRRDDESVTRLAICRTLSIVVIDAGALRSPREGA